MKILMIGRGAVGSVYGWALEKAGHRVEFYVRPGRAATYGPTLTLELLDTRTRVLGVRVRETLPMHYVEELSAAHDYDLIMVSVQHFRFAEVVDFLTGRVGKATVLLFSNLWTDPQAAVAALPADQLVWGFPRAGGSFGTDGVLRGALLKNVIFGEFALSSKADLTPRERELQALFRGSGFGIQTQRDFRGWLWTHFITNAALLPQALKAGSFAAMMGSDAHLREAVLRVRELLPVLAARGVDLSLHSADLSLFKLSPGLAALVLRLAFTLIVPVRWAIQYAIHGDDLAREVGFTSRDVLLEARQRGIAVPRLEAFAAQLP